MPYHFLIASLISYFSQVGIVAINLLGWSGGIEESLAKVPIPRSSGMEDEDDNEKLRPVKNKMIIHQPKRKVREIKWVADNVLTTRFFLL